MASTQHGVVSRSQLREAGLDRAEIQRVVRGGTLVAAGPLVLRAVGSPDSPLRRAVTAVLDAGPTAVLSHTSAAALWGLPGFSIEPIHVIGDRGNQHRASTYLATVHEPRLILEEHTTVLDGVAVTAPPRLIFDLANIGLHPKRVERALDAAWARNLVSQHRMDRALSQLARRGRAGSALMRELLSDRRENYRPPESGLEHRFQELLQRHGLTPMRRQVDVGDGDQWVGRIDFVADDGVRLLCRIQSARYHGALADQRDDQHKNMLLRAAGWVVLEFTDVDVWHRPRQVVDEIRLAIAPATGRVR